MALNPVGARTEGNVFQCLFFWRQAAELLRPHSLVERVVLEHDTVAGVGDVAVFDRQPGVNAGGWSVTADYFQLKYHVGNRDSYSSDALIDPVFIKAKSSLLHRFYHDPKDAVFKALGGAVNPRRAATCWAIASCPGSSLMIALAAILGT